MLSSEGQEDRMQHTGSILAIIKSTNRRTLWLMHIYAWAHRHSKQN